MSSAERSEQSGQSEQADLVERVRDLLADQSTTVEKSMFGVRAFMVNDKLVVGARKNGDLLVRVPAEDHDELLTRPGASQSEMGTGRSMGPGWISVSAAVLETEEALAYWLTIALNYNRLISAC
ncbi:MAG: TfoX/Sxy family protein [Microlunatus sp.]